MDEENRKYISDLLKWLGAQNVEELLGFILGEDKSDKNCVDIEI